jgi:hypothetical protein
MATLTMNMKINMKMITIFMVKVFDNRETWKLQASSKEEMEDWLDVLKRNLVKLLVTRKLFVRALQLTHRT